MAKAHSDLLRRALERARKHGDLFRGVLARPKWSILLPHEVHKVANKMYKAVKHPVFIL